MKVLVTGSRSWTDRGVIFGRLDRLPIDDLTIIHGDHWEGADLMAHQWTMMDRRITEWPVPAAWKSLGRRAGPIRNEIMAALKPDLVLAFRAEGKSNGTDNMISIAQREGFEIEKFSERR